MIREFRLSPLIGSALLVLLASCALFHHEEPFEEASPALKSEIDRLVKDLEYQHGAELLRSNQRLVYIGEPAIPTLLEALRSRDAKTKANATYVLGEIRDRRVVPYLEPLVENEDGSVRYEAAASLLVLGDWNVSVPVLFQGMRDPDRWNRFKAFSVLKNAFRQDFGYDWQAPEPAREEAVKRFEEWWAKGGGGSDRVRP